MIEEHVRKLGFKAKDRVTGFEGVIETIGFDLYGCIQAVIRPGTDKEGNLKEAKWFDIGRLEITSEKPVIDQPAFIPGFIREKAGKEKPTSKEEPTGPADKPER